ncbi:hypothetical protein ABIE06_002543 [Pantoea dispersa]
MLNKLFPENKGKYNERVCNLKEGVTLISLQMAINNSREFSTPNENKIFEEFIKLVLSDEEYEEAFSFMDRRKITFPLKLNLFYWERQLLSYFYSSCICLFILNMNYFKSAYYF